MKRAVKQVSYIMLTILIMPVSFTCKGKDAVPKIDTVVKTNTARLDKHKPVLGSYYSLITDENKFKKYVMQSSEYFWFKYEDDGMYLHAASEGIGLVGVFVIEDVKSLADNKFVFTVKNNFSDDEKIKNTVVKLTMTFDENKKITVTFDDKRYSHASGEYLYRKDFSN
jgi:hypothetical protein